MKKLINDPGNVVNEMLDGLVAMCPGLSRLGTERVVLRSDIEQVRERQVALLSGGGSGHEPAHAGYVGAGMLTAAVAGEVFTSPPTDTVLAALRAVTGAPGAVLIVKNYTGDRLNFGLAAEMARAEGFQVKTVSVADDIALAATQERGQRRGLAGTVLVHKIAGAAAAEGKTLEQVAAIGQAAADDIATVGVSLSAGTVPAVGKPSYDLGEHEVELGLGIHGEPGVRRMELRPADVIVQVMMEAILAAAPVERGGRVVLLVNNLGGTATMELSIVARRALLLLEAEGLIVERVYAGTFVSSLEAAGLSLSLMKVDDERLRLLDAATTAPAWPTVLPVSTGHGRERVIPSPGLPDGKRSGSETSGAVHPAIRAACEAVIAAEERLSELDRAVGDGDLGISLARGGRAMLAEAADYSVTDWSETFRVIGITLQRVLGGSSGPLYGVLFLRLGVVLDQGGPAAFVSACQAVSEMGGARAGDRTMLDALIPFAETFQSGDREGRAWPELLEDALEAAERGAAATANMMPRRGRSSYLGERALGHPDPGAVAVTVWLRAAVTECVRSFRS